MNITDYTKRKRKLEIQKNIYPNITKKTFVGLCGPSVIAYLNKIDYKRFRRITLYENDPSVYSKIIKDLGDKYPTVTVHLDSINLHLGRTKAFYDLDYCKSFKDVRAFMPKIAKIEEFSLTVSTRGKGCSFPFAAFSAYLGHENYVHYTYADGNPMITILANKNINK